MSTPPKPVDFGPAALAAALECSTEHVLAMARSGELLPDHTRGKEPRWRADSLHGIFKFSPGCAAAKGWGSRALWCMQALERAEKAEGWHDEKGVQHERR